MSWLRRNIPSLQRITSVLRKHGKKATIGVIAVLALILLFNPQLLPDRHCYGDVQHLCWRLDVDCADSSLEFQESKTDAARYTAALKEEECLKRHGISGITTWLLWKF